MIHQPETKSTSDTESSQAQAHKRPLSLSSFGFGFYWAWLWICSNSTVVSAFSESRTQAEVQYIFIVCVAASAVVLLIGAFFFRQLSTPLGRRLLIGGACFLAVASTALLAYYPGAGSVDWPGILAAALMGISRACFNLLWCKSYSSIGLKQASLSMSGSIALGAFVYLIITSMTSVAAFAFTLLLPLAAIVSESFVERSLNNKEDQAGSKPSGIEQDHSSDAAEQTRIKGFPFAFFWRLFLGIGIYAIAFAFINNTLFKPDFDQITTAFKFALLGVAIVGLLISVIAAQGSKRLNLVFAYRLILPLTAVGFLLIPLLGNEQGNFTVIFVMVGFTVFDILTWLILANSSARLRLSPYQVFGLGRGAHFIGMFIGATVAFILSSSAESFEQFFVPVSLVMVFLLIIASTLVLTENTLFGKDGISLDGLSKTSAQQRNNDEEQGRARWRARCEAIAQEYKLSPREEEVFLLLAKGRDTIFVEKELNISNHTARSHVHHIYQKLDVHSRQELLDLIEKSSEGK